MEQYADSLQTFKTILGEAFTDILKHLPKKYKDFRELVQKTQEEVMNEKDKKAINGNKYFIIFSMAIGSHIPRLCQSCIHYIEKLIAYRFMDGNCYDYTQDKLSIDGEKKAQIDPNRKLIDQIIDSICDCVNLKDENVHLQIIRSLLTIATSSICQVHGQNLEKIMRTLIVIHCTSKQPQIQDPSKHSFTQIILETFKRMEKNTLLSQEETQIYQNKKQIGPVFNPNSSSSYRSQGNSSNILLSADQSVYLMQNHEGQQQQQQQQNSVQIDPLTSNNELMNQMVIQIDEDQQKQIISNYVSKVVTNLVDDVCIYEDKIKKIQRKYMNQPENEVQKQAEINLIPRKSVPNMQDVDTPQYKKTTIASIKNEKEIDAGKFGWCFVCRNEASNFCKDTRVPICSKECKKQHMEEVARIARLCFKGQEVAVNQYIIDALTVFQFLCKLSQEDPNNNLNANQLRQKVIILELILKVMDQAGSVFLSRKEFVQAVQDKLVPSLLQNCLSTEKSVYGLSFSIVANLIDNFRENLKTEISVFIENIFVKILESTNSNFFNRVYCLKVFNKIFSIPRAVIEMFVNYDCSMNQNNTIEQLITLLTKISQGKYQKAEFQNLIQPEQAQELKNLSLECIVQLMQSINDFVMICDAQENQVVSKSELPSKEEQNLQTENENNISKVNNQDEIKDPIERERQMKLEFQKGISKFNFKPKVGIRHFIQHGLIEEGNPKHLAELFFKFNNQINHEKIGEIFGSHEENNKRILAEFIEYLNFENLDLVNSLRKYLTYFQLPGEGEQVDRILEKFGEKYSLDNPECYKNATTSYTLSYALMMLHTSSHSAQVQEKERMTLPQFIKLVKGIDDGNDLPEQMVVNMYNDVKKNPLGIHHLEASKKAFEDALTSSVSRKHEMFLKETEQMFEKGQMKIQRKENEKYIQVFTKDYILSLLQIVWSPVFATISQATMIEQEKERENLDLIAKVLTGFKNSIKLLGQFGMLTERETFVFELCRLTGLLTPQKLIRQKNVQAIKIMLEICTQCRNYLGRSWKILLECVSKLDNYYLIAQNLRRDIDLLNNDTYFQDNNNMHQDEIDKYNSQVIMKYIDMSEIDKIFHLSNQFDAETIVEFIRCLCELSKEELENIHNPRIFCIQRIGEVTEFNMSRVRIIWNKIWDILKVHYNNVGCHNNIRVSCLAIDSLKQLAVKFLEKTELAHYQFQKDFLSPFEYIYQRNPQQNLEIKELILRCLFMMTMSKAQYLRSGWKVILRVVNLTLQEDSQILLDLAIQITDLIMNQKNLDNTLDVFGDLIHALTNQTKYKNDMIALKALDHLKKCIQYLVENTQQEKDKDQEQKQHNKNITAMEASMTSEAIAEDDTSSRHSKNTKQNIIINESKRLLEGYSIPILSNFASFFNDDRPKMIIKSVTYLFDSIKQYSYTFNQEFWNLIFKGVLRPLFDDMQFTFQKNKSGQTDIIKATKNACQKAFTELVNIFVQQFDTLHPCLTDFIAIMNNSISTNQEIISSISLSSLKTFLSRIGQKLNENEWNLIIESLQGLALNCKPIEMLEAKNASEDFNVPIQQLLSKPIYKDTKYDVNIDCQKNIIQCVIFKNMVELILNIIEEFTNNLNEKQIDSLTYILKDFSEFCDEFNSRLYLRFYLWKSGLNSKNEAIPVLGKQEKLSKGGVLLVLYERYKRTQSLESLDIFLGETENYLRQLENVLNEIKQNNEQQILKQQQQQLQQQSQSQSQNSIKNSKQGFSENNTPQMSERGQQNQVIQNVNTMHLNDKLLSYAYEDKERQLKALRFIVGSYILPNLHDIDPKEIGERLRKIVNLLLEVSNQDADIDDDFNYNLKIILKKYFNFVFDLASSTKR
ncbi:Sec7 domain protein (macronuclear) [Tetrahymena thermophila SB210]|uniref:Sec7 domain protein n=1 Tax=Tetrahymena thermophila (strain SB210) TaxID=312017 RepID=Q22E49_TETTS|nr:Sec7 domain protein [Tetrahymena thermophila SB210]EAR83565.3 Sec7 domain protein [Tetrahymena thermophila SB210]|eukprot:XP_001031228.3 Sec7 domain protein [Tetrahymena thermophila SB210]